MPELSSYGLPLRYRGHWGVRLRMEHGRMEIAVPRSVCAPTDVRLPDRALGIEPGEICHSFLTDDD